MCDSGCRSKTPDAESSVATLGPIVSVDQIGGRYLWTLIPDRVELSPWWITNRSPSRTMASHNGFHARGFHASFVCDSNMIAWAYAEHGQPVVLA
jgi:hypothetical protein